MWAWTCCGLLFLVLLPKNVVLWSSSYAGDELPRDVVLDWMKIRILEGLGLKEAPLQLLHRPELLRVPAAASSRTRRAHEYRRHQTSQVILFPSSESTCTDASNLTYNAALGRFTYYFQSSLDSLDSMITSANFWFYAGKNLNVSASLFILTHEQELLQASDAPLSLCSDGWTSYMLDPSLHGAMAEGPFILQVHCEACSCFDPDVNTPFLHLHTRPSRSIRSRRSPLIPWSPTALDDLRRPAFEDTDCRREQIEISFEDLGWDNWIVHPKAFTFYYCHGNCSSTKRTATLLGMKQCCAPVPESMRSLRFTTTSDGGHSFKFETLPNIIPWLISFMEMSLNLLMFFCCGG